MKCNPAISSLSFAQTQELVRCSSSRMTNGCFYSAIDLVNYQPGRVGVSSISPLGLENPEGLNTRLFEDEVEHAYLRISLGAVQYVVRGLRDFPGRRA